MKKRRIIVIVVLLILGLLSYYIYDQYGDRLFNKQNHTDNTEKQKPNEKEPEPERPKLQIVDMDSNTRSIAVMIDNHARAIPHHKGLSDAYLIYEIIAEGGISRLFAIYKDAKTEVIGPVRSARHYFLDYAFENDAVYVHFGHSPKALADISTLKVNNINGIYYDPAFWRDKNISAPHNAFTSMERLNNAITKKKYRATTEKEVLLNYSIEAIELNEVENAILANNITIEYSSSNVVNYEYDPTNKVYKRYARGKPHIDEGTKEQYTFKNIIVYQVYNFPLKVLGGSSRQDLANTGSGEGYYITNGYAIPITWEKGTRSSQTIYKDLNGEEIKINDGSTFINIQPQGKKLELE